MAVCDVQCSEGHRQVISECFSRAHIQLRVPWQMTRWYTAAVGVSRADVDVRGDKGLPRQIRVETDIRCIALVVIECVEAGRGTEVCEAASDRSVSVGRLVGIGDVSLTDIPQLR